MNQPLNFKNIFYSIQYLTTCIVALASTVAFTATSTAQVQHVVHISVDGLRGDFLQDRINNSPALYPNFKRFQDEGATTFNARTDYTQTNTLPNHTSMLTGRPAEQPAGLPDTTHHGYLFNGSVTSAFTLHNVGNTKLSYVASSFDVAHDNGLSTALFASKTKFDVFDQSYRAATGAPDTTGADNGADKIDTYVNKFNTPVGPPKNAANLNADFIVDLGANEYNYSFLHYRDPDSAGHAGIWGDAVWDTAIQNVDGYLGDVLNLIENDPGLAGETAIIITADHGGTDRSHLTVTDPANYTIPVFVWGPGVAVGADLYDLNPTTRLNPGTGRPTYVDAGQPIRNGGTGNLALNLLGVGPIPGSLINGTQDLNVAQVPEPSSAVLFMGLGILLGTSRKPRS